jgi:hypothetical protein
MHQREPTSAGPAVIKDEVMHQQVEAAQEI